MDDGTLAAQQPTDIGGALDCMESTLRAFHDARDRRAIFLRVYHEMTLEVYRALEGIGDYRGQPVFLDPDWIRGLSGIFASHYFSALAVTGDPHGGPGRRAWRCANGVAGEPRSTVLQNALLGINAHINADLAEAIADKLDPVELKDPATLQLRKFDHDQVNNLLVRSLGRIQDVLAKDYCPGIGLGDRLLGSLDERLSKMGLAHYRERVWWDALSFATARAEDRAEGAGTHRRERLVRDKLDWESHTVAQELLAWRWPWRVERVLGLPWARGAERRWAAIAVRGRG